MWTSQEIADSYYVDRSTVQARRRATGIYAAHGRPRRKWQWTYPVLANEAILRKLYVQMELSIAEIATATGASRGTVLNALNHHGIPRRSSGHRAPHKNEPPNLRHTARTEQRDSVAHAELPKKPVITGTQARRDRQTAENARRRGTPNDMAIARTTEEYVAGCEVIENN